MNSNSFCPYKGLQPYAEEDRAYFFGRARDQEIIASNLYAAPLTILYGASGVGKSSVLMAGVVPQLRQSPRLAVVVFRTWQDVGFVTALKTEILRVLLPKAGSARIDPALPFDEFLEQCTRTLRGSLFFIFDQFEDYLQYHRPSAAENSFEAELARAVNRRELHAHFMLSLRDDGLSRLDRFKGRIPNLLGNMLRLHHLDRVAADEAIRKPLAEYNRHLTAGQSPIAVEDGLVDAVIAQVQTGQVALGVGGRGQFGGRAEDQDAPGAEPDVRIETPYLQLVMTRIWDEEARVNSRTLHLATLARLGGAERIVRTHLDATMSRLTNPERLTAARAFRYLVTPSGTKIAYVPADLATYADVPPAQLLPVLTRLVQPEMRVLRAVAPPEGAARESSYEIFHDVLGPAILDWRARYLEERRRRRLQIAGATMICFAIIIIAGLLFFAWRNAQEAQAALVRTQATAQASKMEAQVAQTAANQAAQVALTAAPSSAGVRETVTAIFTYPTPAPTEATALGVVVATPGAMAKPSVTPSPSATPCPLAVASWLQAQFARDRSLGALGCPREAAHPQTLAQQVFQNGMMFWRGETREILVLYKDGKLEVYEDKYATPQPPGPFLTPMPGQFEPVFGFGKVWREKLGGPNATIGWGKAPENMVNGQWQTFEHGYVFRDEDGAIKVIFYQDGRWKGL